VVNKYNRVSLKLRLSLFLQPKLINRYNLPEAIAPHGYPLTPNRNSLSPFQTSIFSKFRIQFLTLFLLEEGRFYRLFSLYIPINGFPGTQRKAFKGTVLSPNPC
jgi:hypothetical protein